MPLNDPVPSTAADVLERNVQDFDRFVVSPANTFVNRLGVEKLTISGIHDVVLTGNPAVQAAQQAIDAKNGAQAAYDAIINSGALQSAGIYETITDGLAGVADGEYFWVYPNSLNSIENLTLFKRVDATTEELVYVQYNLNAFMIEEGANWETGL